MKCIKALAPVASRKHGRFAPFVHVPLPFCSPLSTVIPVKTGI